MTATDKLRKLLDERGVEWQADDIDTLLHTVWENQEGQLCTHFEAIGECAGNWHDEVSIYRVTPERAVAATLGNEPPYDELLRCLENDWNISASWDGLRRFWHIGLTEEGVRMRDAELGSGTCEVVGSYYYDDYDQYEFEFSCGHSVNMYDKEPPNYCPNCGKAVKR